ncbi:MAG: hypothetical protein QOE14_427 [Humisphaera sp.]|nr:hypothetical protein [Humisphaera sp.]
MRKPTIGLVIVFWIASVGCAESRSQAASPSQSRSAADIKFTVDAGGVARRNAPVVAMLSGVENAPPSGPAVLTSDSAAVPAQVGNLGEGKISVRWIEPNLAADQMKTYTLKLQPGVAGNGAKFHFVDGGDNWRDLYRGNKPVMSQIFKYDPKDHAGTFKPFDQVYTFSPTTQPATQPHGELDKNYQFITKGVGGQYTHHRGIFFGFNKTAYGDFWHCPDVAQRHASFDTQREWAGPLAAKMVAVTNWVAKDNQPKFRDTRAVTAWRVSDDELVLDYDITLETLTGKPEPVGGDAHHAGFHFRASNELVNAADKSHRAGAASYLFPAGAKLVTDDVWSGAEWVNATFELFGRRYSVTHMDSPANPDPTTYSTRGYGRFGAFFTSETTPEKPLKVSYRLVIRDITGAATTQPSKADVDAEYQNFAKPAMVKLAD